MPFYNLTPDRVLRGDAGFGAVAGLAGAVVVDRAIHGMRKAFLCAGKGTFGAGHIDRFDALGGTCEDHGVIFVEFKKSPAQQEFRIRSGGLPFEDSGHERGNDRRVIEHNRKWPNFARRREFLDLALENRAVGSN